MSHKITKSMMLYKITQFGRIEEHRLIEEKQHHEAYQIEHARNHMLYALMYAGVTGVREVLPKMTGDGGLFCATEYVTDDRTRNLLHEFAKTIQ